MRRRHQLLLAVQTALIVSGCAATPSIEFNRIDDASQLRGDEVDSFAFQRSFIKIDAKKDSKGALVVPVEVTITSVPIEFNDFKVALRRADTPGVRTNLNLTKFENTDLVKEVGTEVVDSRVELINKIGGILAKLAPIAFSATEGISSEALPQLINTQVVMAQNNVQANAANDISVADGISIDFGPIPKDAKSINTFPNGQAVSAFYYAACRTALVKVALTGASYKQTLKISDPRYFQSVGLPHNGKVTMHSECGASVSANKDTGIKSTADIVDALTAQGKSIKEAIDAAKKDGK